jgi:MFS family permease
MIFLTGDGFATIGWLDMLTRAFPSEKRGSYIASWQAISSLGIMGVSVLVGIILADSGPQFPENYVILFGLGVILFFLSALGTLSIYEPPLPPDAPQTTNIPWRDFGAHLLQIWRTDSRLRKLAAARVIFSFAMMSFSFFVLFATDQLHLPAETIGSFITAQTVGTMIAGLALGRVADRFGPQRAVQIGAVITATAPILGLAMSMRTGWSTAWLIAIYVWIYICTGLANNILFLGFGNYLLDIAPAGQRTIYIGAVNAINSIGVVAPFVAGLLAATSYTVLFAVTLGFCLVALVMVFRLPHSRQADVMVTSVLDRAQR